MLRAFFTSATGMRAQELMIDNTANNLANVNTNGFKRSQIDFADLLYASERTAGVPVTQVQNSPIGLEIGSGVRVQGTTKAFTPGVIQETGIVTDVAVEGEGFFRVLMPNGEFRYTRDGSFRVAADGTLVTSDGFPLDQSPQIPDDVPLSRVSIGLDGTVSAGEDPIGQIRLYRFINPAGLQSVGNNLYAATNAAGEPIESPAGENGMGLLRQQYLERSNVEVVRELVALITAQRAYEINARAIRAGDEMLSNTAQIVR